MQLNVARVCLDCEEVHDAQQCPVCASETFAYLSKWVPRVERRFRSRPVVRPIVTPTRVQRIIFGGGVLSLLAYGFHEWSKRAQKTLEVAASRGDTGELR
jgi:hypothetical protein